MNEVKTFEEIRRKHLSLLKAREEGKKDLLDDARAFVEEIGRAGAQIATLERRLHLLDILNYWLSYISGQTGELLRVDLQPAAILSRDKKAKSSDSCLSPLVLPLLLLCGIVMLLSSPLQTPTPTPLIIVGPPSFPGWTWESCTNEGWIAQTYSDSQGIESVAGFGGVALTGSCSLKLNTRLQARHPNFSKGEAYIELSAPWSFDGVTISCWVYVPDNATGPQSSSNGAQLFVKDASYKNEYGGWVNLNQSGWNRVTLTPTTSTPPNGGYKDTGFNPNAVLIIGVKIATNKQSPADYSYNGPFYVDDCTW